MLQTFRRPIPTSTPSYLTYEEEDELPLPSRSRRVGEQIVNFTVKAVDRDDNSQVLEFPVIFSSKGGYELSKLKKYQDIYPAFKKYNQDLKITKVLDVQPLSSADQIPPTALTPIVIT